MHVTQALRDTENALRDFIALTLERAFGPKWLDNCGATPERIAKWRERKTEERRRQEAGVVDERLLYYADFYDLKTIFKKHWAGEFTAALGEWRRFEVLFDELARYRDPDAHRRELLPHQQSLIIGIAGDIRTRLIRWRSSLDSLDDCFPRIESARDNLGNQWTPSAGSASQLVLANSILRPGDTIDFVVTARDPEDLPLEYGLLVDQLEGSPEWARASVFSLTIEEAHIGATFRVTLLIRSPRPYHAHRDSDDFVVFSYRVLPTRRKELTDISPDV